MSDQRLVTETRRRIDIHDYEAVFAHGGCFHFALRLHERFNLRLRGIREGYLIHVWGLKPDGNGVDIRGVYPEELLAKLAYGGNEPPICDVSEAEVRERVKAKGYPPDLEKELFDLADWIIEKHERFSAAKPVDENLIAEGLKDLQRSSNYGHIG
jgi:hypothetical protein